MNLQQLQYIVAVDSYRQFGKAAGKCFVTQPTLSMMIQKLEEELGMKIFDRSKLPITTTKAGAEVIVMAKQILNDTEKLKAFATELRGEISGAVRLGVIPTLAPYLLPLFLTPFTKKHPELQIFVKEMVTDEIISGLKLGEVDIGLLATPLGDGLLTEKHLFYEEFFVYASRNEKLPRKKYLLKSDINLRHLWLLEEGHCLRNQVFNLCELKKREVSSGNLHYQAGSIETLINLVDKHDGITIVPHLAVSNLNPSQKKRIHRFANPTPVREISLVVAKNFPRVKLLKSLKEEIIRTIPFRHMIESALCQGENPSNCEECTLDCLHRSNISSLVPIGKWRP